MPESHCSKMKTQQTLDREKEAWYSERHDADE
jgi:hypothetical protein